MILSYRLIGSATVAIQQADLSGVVTGCDSLATLNVTVNPTLLSTTTTVCDTELPFDWNGLTFTAAGSQNAYECSNWL